jgi:hypothetical protein
MCVWLVARLAADEFLSPQLLHWVTASFSASFGSLWISEFREASAAIKVASVITRHSWATKPFSLQIATIRRNTVSKIFSP